MVFCHDLKSTITSIIKANKIILLGNFNDLLDIIMSLCEYSR